MGMSLTNFIEVFFLSWLALSLIPLTVVLCTTPWKNRTRRQLLLLLSPLACPFAIAPLVLCSTSLIKDQVTGMDIFSDIMSILFLVQVVWSVLVFRKATGFRRHASAVLLLELWISCSSVGAFMIAFGCAMVAGGA